MSAYKRVAARLFILGALVLGMTFVSNPPAVYAAQSCCQDCFDGLVMCLNSCETLPQNQRAGCLAVCTQNRKSCDAICGCS